jgi:hypothetical protein
MSRCICLQEGELDGMEMQRDMDLVRQVLSYERDRVRFLLKAYLRARLEKIEQFAGESYSTTTAGCECQRKQRP